MGDLKAELFASGSDGLFEPLQMAQDPNPFPNGSWVYAGFSEILAANTSWFVLDAAAPHVRLDLWRSATNLSLYGHWDSDYGDMKSYRVLSMAPIKEGPRHLPEAFNITLDGGVVVTPGRRFVATDALALLDSPGEYWIDRQSLKLFLVPPRGGIGSRSYFLSVGPSLADPSASKRSLAGLLEIHSVPHLRLENLTVAASTQSLLIANGSTGLEIEGCDFLGAGLDCVSVTNAAHTRIRGSTIAHCGGTGLTLTGGTWAADSEELSLFDTPELPADLWVPANVSLIDSHLHHWARLQRVSSRPGISWTGVGHTIRGCTIVSL